MMKEGKTINEWKFIGRLAVILYHKIDALFLSQNAVWPDLPNFSNFCKILKALGNFVRVYLVFGEMLNLD